MSKRMRVLGLAIALVALTAPAIADSHEGPVYIWINLVKAKPGQGDALIGYWMEEDAKIYDPLVESGAAFEWGIAMPIVHPDTESHIQWITFAGWAGVDAFMRDFMASRQAMSPEDQAESMERYAALVEPGTHRDMINRSVKLGSMNLSRPGYIHLAYFRAKPGMDSEAVGMLGEFDPVFDDLLADGTIQNYGTHVPALHRGESWTHMGWWSSENLAARDAVMSAMMTGTEDAMARWPEVFETEHTDQVLLVVHHKVAGGGE